MLSASSTYWQWNGNLELWLGLLLPNSLHRFCLASRLSTPTTFLQSHAFCWTGRRLEQKECTWLALGCGWYTAQRVGEQRADGWKYAFKMSSHACFSFSNVTVCLKCMLGIFKRRETIARLLCHLVSSHFLSTPFWWLPRGAKSRHKTWVPAASGW